MMNNENVRKQTDVNRQRIITYLSVGIGLTLCYVALRGTNWHGSTTLHTVMEAVSTLLALIVGVMALVRFYSKKNNTFLFIGSGFLGTAFLDGYHTIVTSVAFQPFMPSDLPSLIPWSWIASRQFLSIFLFLSVLAWLREQRLGEAGRINEKAVYVFAGAFTLLSFAFFAFAPLPHAYYPEFVLHRPEELLPAMFFLAALIGYLRKGNWRIDPFEHWLVLSLIIGFVGQVAFMSFSGGLFDLEFDAAHLLKKASYVCVLTGLLANLHSILQREAERGRAMVMAKEKAEAALAELASHKQAMDEHAIVSVTDTKGIITYVNDKFCEISKYDRDELLGSNHSMLTSNHHPTSYFDDMNQTIESGKPWHGEIKNRAKDGSEYWDNTTIAPIKDSHGKIVEYVHIRGNITDLKRAERDVQVSNQVLELRVSELEEMGSALEKSSSEAIKYAEDLSAAKNGLDQTHRHLLSAVNSMRNGFVIWDANDRLMLANNAYLDFYEPIRDTIVKGLKFKDLLSVGLDKGVWDTEGMDKDAWINMQMESRRSFSEAEKEVQFVDGRQVIVSEKVLENGDITSTLIDVTAHRERELELQDTKQQLEKIAYFDGLTGLANRAHCQKDLIEKFTFADPNSKFAVIQIDLDNFKRVNDTLGHAAGDHLLQKLGKRLTFFASEFNNFKSYRWGGDEFIALVERDENTNLNAICQELTDLISIPLEYNRTTLRPTVSLGVARYPEDAPDVEALMIFADLALYKTKELGRDGYQFFTSEMKEKIDAESRIEYEMRIAIDEGQLELYFQPQLNVNDESISGIEALLRWNHPHRGMLLPGEFLSVVEATDLAPAVGCKVFDDAMTAIRCWVDEGLDFGRLAVNLSPQHLKKNTILDDLFDTMDSHGVEPRHLAVEFLESFIFDDPNANIMEILGKLRERGIHVELDDFGTGYASLSHLSTMPINGLKIDKSFVSHMDNNKKQQGIVSALITMSKLMQLRVVCEGIETRQQLDAVSQIGNCSIQGYFVAKPMSFEAMTDWIRADRNIGILKTLPDIAVVNG